MKLNNDTLFTINLNSSLSFFGGNEYTGYARDHGVLHFDSIQIFLPDSTETRKEFHHRDNWELMIIENKNEKAIYQFILTNQDIF